MSGVACGASRPLETQQARAGTRAILTCHRSARTGRKEGALPPPFSHTPRAEARGVLPMTGYPSLSAIQAAVCEHFRVTRLDLLSRRRGRDVARPRQVGMWLARHATPASLPEIGRAFGGRDHTTVLHAVRLIDGLVAFGLPQAHDALALLRRVQGGDERQIEMELAA